MQASTADLNHVTQYRSNHLINNNNNPKKIEERNELLDEVFTVPLVSIVDGLSLPDGPTRTTACASQAVTSWIDTKFQCARRFE